MQVSFEDISAIDPRLEDILLLWGEAFPNSAVTQASLKRYLEVTRTRLENSDNLTCIAALQEGRVAGSALLYRFRANYRGSQAIIVGLSGLATSSTLRQAGLGSKLLSEIYRRTVSYDGLFTAAYPAIPDFYRKNGFGYGTPLFRLRLESSALPKYKEPSTRVRALDVDDADTYIKHIDRVQSNTHGMFHREHWPVSRQLSDESVKVIVVERESQIRASMLTTHVPGPAGTLNTNELIVRDLLSEDGEARRVLFGYLAGLRTQYPRIVLESHERDIFAMFDDPRDDSHRAVGPDIGQRFAEVGLGMMYRVASIQKAIETMGVAPYRCVIRLNVVLENNQTLSKTFLFSTEAAPRVDDSSQVDASISIGIADLSSCLMGSLRLKDLEKFGRARIEPVNLAAVVDHIFRSDEPICISRF